MTLKNNTGIRNQWLLVYYKVLYLYLDICFEEISSDILCQNLKLNDFNDQIRNIAISRLKFQES